MSMFFKNNRFEKKDLLYIDSDGVVYDNPDLVGYKNYSVTEQAGYKPPRIQVLDFMIAGERLVSAQKAAYYQSAVEPLFDSNGDVLLPSLLKSRDPYLAKKDMDYFNSRLDEYKDLFNKRKQDEFRRNQADQDKYKKFYEDNYSKFTSNSSQNAPDK